MENWYIRLKELREQKNMSQTDLAQKMGIHLAQVNRYEKGKGATSVTGNLKYKLLDVFTKDEVDYIEYGERGAYSKNSMGNVGSNSHVNQDGIQTIGGITLDAKEQMLIELYREAGEEGKKNILKAALAGTLLDE